MLVQAYISKIRKLSLKKGRTKSRKVTGELMVLITKMKHFDRFMNSWVVQLWGPPSHFVA